MSDRSTRLTGLYAATAAVAAVVLAPLLALSYFAIGEGADELENGTVRAWADPARDVVGGLLTWASPERVYATYVQAFAVLFPAVFLCARAVRAHRSPLAAASAGAGGSHWPATVSRASAWSPPSSPSSRARRTAPRSTLSS